jgi:hypothetical protein
MADDIVARLRMPICGNYDDDHPSWGPQPCSSCVEAADEIERLRSVIQWFEHTQTCPNYGVRSCWRCVTPANQKSIMEAMFD